ncbi:MAG: SOS response-associated peptidase [Acidothermus sp.]|nr:SOS response-associated peptidase [Acidothermus sp.]MCL6538594.1 SOS response-associated peptidase [Acidothermus sp.]
MCGRYAAARDPADLAAAFRVDEVAAEGDLPPRYNIAPTDPVYAVLTRADGGSVPRRQLRVVRWGLVPSWAADPKIGSRLINARLETVGSKPAFRKAFAVRRCLIPADGYYEWYRVQGPGKPRKQPFFIRPKDGGILPMAGIYELWKDPSNGEWLWSCAVITTRAEDELGYLHERMPTFVAPDNWERWLDPRLTDPDLAVELLRPASPGWLEAHPVSTLVNDVRRDGPELITSVEVPAGTVVST